MIKIIKMEMWKIFHGRMFWITLSVAMAIVLCDVFQNYYLVVTDFNSRAFKHSGYEGYSLFVRWIGINSDTLGEAVFLFVFPLLAVLPYGWSHLSEMKSGYTNNILCRTSRRNYIISKYIAVFMSGGLVIAIPMFFNLMGNAMVCPACIPTCTSMLTSVWQGAFLPMLYYTHPWIYSLIWIAVDFLWGGAISCISLALGFFIKKNVLLLLTPFAVFVAFDFCISLFSGTTKKMKLELSPLHLLHETTYNLNPAWLVFGMIFLLIILTAIITFRMGKRYEGL